MGVLDGVHGAGGGGREAELVASRSVQGARRRLIRRALCVRGITRVNGLEPFHGKLMLGYGSQMLSTAGRVLAAAVVLASQSAFADGPFGVTMGSSPNAYPSCVAIPNEPGTFGCTSLPRPHPDLKNYFMLAFEGVGICSVTGIGDTIRSDSSGQIVRSAVDEFASQLHSIYGRWEKTDTGPLKGPTSEGQFWMYTLSTKDRIYEYRWKTTPKGAPMKHGVTEIILMPVSVSASSASIGIRFNFANAEQCQAAIQKAKQNAF